MNVVHILKGSGPLRKYIYIYIYYRFNITKMTPGHV